MHVKRKVAQSFDRSKPVPLKEVINFGPVTAAELESIGITTLDQVEELGFEEVARRWVEHFPERLNVAALMGIVATLDGISWTRALENRVRRELSLPPVKQQKKKGKIRRL